MRVSCLLPTNNRRAFLPASIACFLAQDYLDSELIVVDDGTDCVRDLVPDTPRIRYTKLEYRHAVGAKRNIACQQAAGDVILHWDDDDWMAQWRISYQVEELERSRAVMCGLDRVLYYEPASERAWEYAYPKANRPWVAGNTLCYRKAFWQRHRFADVNVGEDSRFVWQARPGEVLRHEKNDFIVATVHAGNVSPKVTEGSFWTPLPASVVRERMCRGTSVQVAEISAPTLKVQVLEKVQPQALIAASLGVGDILRITPLAAVLHAQGYAVDLLLHADFADTTKLLDGRKEIRTIYTDAGATPVEYDTAVFTMWSAGDAAAVRAKRKMVFDRTEWLTRGDTHCVATMAGRLGWRDPLPLPFASHSGRGFALEPGTIAIHPGCKADWPWKKWHGFDRLAALLPRVVLIGTEADLRNEGTYFGNDFHWPAHVRNYIGKLGLLDTAALLSQCAALVSNDSGMMHLGVALGVPTLGVFGITSPQRETMRSPKMIAVTKGLPCESACRTKAYGRRDCEHHLACLKSLTAEEVLARLPEGLVPRKETAVTKPLTLAYHGHVFDASGYGHAARAYVHALHTAGVKLQVSDLSTHPRQVSDGLVESLLAEPQGADFQLFHGVPHVWAQKAFRVPNAIAMTVWETDTMPTQWSNSLNHALEVWLPCNYNIDVFQRHLRRPAVKVPHPLMPRTHPGDGTFALQLELSPETFVFYSILEWQDRKSPSEQMVCFLRAFTAADDVAYVVKTNPGAAAVAGEALHAARQQTGSKARVVLCAEGWTEDQIGELHARGDCYVSLHRGEGWAYSLFEAACAGKPVVATAYSGPMDYLDAEHHQLVRWSPAPVRQPYTYYHPRMRWAQPDFDDAVRRMRWVSENREDARTLAREAAPSLLERYSLEAVGKQAKAKLMALLERTDRNRWLELRAEEAGQRHSLPLPLPIPGNWFDADYFEHGIKSNWTQGYQWRHFGGLFQESARFLMTMFPEARAFFDVGCAKGFLVRALREAGREAWGCDVSRWAVDHAEREAAPYIQCAAAESFAWERSYDVLVALHLLSQMNEAQVSAFLQRARSHVNTALLAAIPLETPGPLADRNDPAHVLRHTREWWHEQFLAAGWQQDGLHRAMQSMCQAHSLPARMGWELFVYAPGTP